VKTRLFKALSAIMLIACSFLSTSCSDGGGGGGVLRDELINASGEAWIDGRKGFVFRENGTVQYIKGNSSGDWEVEEVYPWILRGNTLTVDGKGGTLSFDGTVMYWDGYWDGWDEWELQIRKVSLNGGGGGGGGGGGSGITREQLINSAGQAWTDRHEWGVGSSEGFILNADNTVQWIYDNPAGNWVVESQGTWSLSGNTLTIISRSRTVSFDGTTLLWDGQGYRKMNVIMAGGGGGGGGGGNITREQLINPAGQAWTDRHEWGYGLIFNSDNTVQWILENSSGNWVIAQQGTWSLSGNTLTMFGELWDISFNGTTLVIDGDEFKRTNNITMISGGTITREQLINSPGQAWTNRHEQGVGNSFGLVFNANGTLVSIIDWSGNWEVFDEVDWSLSGNTLTMYEGEEQYQYHISFDGTTLYLAGVELRRTNVTITNLANFSSESRTRNIRTPTDERPTPRILNRNPRNR